MSHYTGWRASLQPTVAIRQCSRSNDHALPELLYRDLAGTGGCRFWDFFDGQSTFDQQFNKKVAH
ncbi:hypothetical protein [Herbaspirillum lusitanum]|uniref:hypothetical protein n=1 Tax=Herbaspirillum lusitanum TaxID=213312 RepID=UPI00223748A7|nr:hypothetical protein [Herbaspirillum lusitanum]